MSVSAQWTSDSAFNLELGKKEAYDWIQAVIGERLSSPDFQQALKDGRALCKLINQIKPGTVKKINAQKTDYAEMENISFYVQGAKNLGLKDTQVFTTKELHEKDGRIRDVVISLYWLGRAARGVPTYKGPHLNLNAFHSAKMKCSKCRNPIEDNNYLATMDQQFHRKCAACSKCKNPLDPKEPFYQLGNEIFCPRCKGQLEADNESGKLNRDEHSHSSLGHKHGGHKCGKCKKNLDNQPHVHGDDGLDYCTDCICESCHNPLKGKELVKGGKKYCPDCYCGECSKIFSDDGFFEYDGKNICPQCYDKHRNKSAPSSSKSAPLSSSSSRSESTERCPSCSSEIPKGAQFCPECGSSTKKPHNHDHSKKGGKNCKACGTGIDNKKPIGHDSDKYCDPHANEYCCGGCNDEINGPAIQALNKKYHPDCFNCTNCKLNIPKKCGGKFQQNEGNPFCNPCYDKMFGKFGFCAGCGQKLDRGGIEALGHKWHQKCFNCAKCHKDFANGEYFEHEEMPYCATCVPKEGPEFCFECQKPLSGEVTNLYGKNWHKGCFKCHDCKKSLIQGFFPFEGIPYCESCNLKRSADKCQSCAKPLVGEAIGARGKFQWHKSPACFKCATCSKSLTDMNESSGVFIKFGRPYCRTCNPGGTTAPKFCANCGTAVSGGKFCNNCGVKL